MFERVLNTSLNRHAKSNQTSFKASYFVIMLRQITVLSVRLLNFMSVKKFCNFFAAVSEPQSVLTGGRGGGGGGRGD